MRLKLNKYKEKSKEQFIMFLMQNIRIILWFFVLFCFIPYAPGFSQGLTNIGNLRIMPNSCVKINGNFLNKAGTSAGQIDLDGKMTVTGNWNNTAGNNVFINIEATPDGIVELSGTSNQAIGPASASGGNPTFFENLTLNNTNGVTLNINTTVKGILTLTNGALKLNNNTLIIDNSSTGAITRTNGYILSNALDQGFLSKVRWNIGTATGSYIYPFGIIGTYLPFTFNVTGAGVDTVTISTYPTGGTQAEDVYNNKPTVVTNLDGACGTGNSGGSGECIVRRFWNISPSGAGTATITFTYATTEEPINGKSDSMRAQRYNTVTNVWEQPIAGQSSDVSANTVQVPNVTNFSPWVIAKGDALLPIELLFFTGFCKNGIVQIEWATASETNNDYFTIERSKSLTDSQNNLSDWEWEVIGTVDGAGNSNTIQYYTYIYTLPSLGEGDGGWAFRLKQTDFDGNYEYFDPIAVTCETQDEDINFDILSVYSNNENSFINIIYTTSGDDKLTIIMYNTLGQKIIEEQIISEKGTNSYKLYTVNIHLSFGVYYLNFYSKLENKIITKRIVLH